VLVDRAEIVVLDVLGKAAARLAELVSKLEVTDDETRALEL